MQINIDGMKMYQELSIAYKECAEHKGCVGCNKNFKIGDSVIYCEKYFEKDVDKEQNV